MTDAVTLDLALDRGTVCEPGARVSGVASWSGPRAPRRLELQLSFTSLGWGGRDLKIVETIALGDPRAEERRPFTLTLPEGPYSFRGALVSLGWTLELLALPGQERVRLELTIAPGGRVVDLR